MYGMLKIHYGKEQKSFTKLHHPFQENNAELVIYEVEHQPYIKESTKYLLQTADKWQFMPQKCPQNCWQTYFK